MARRNTKFISAKKFATVLIDLHKYAVQVNKNYMNRTLIELRTFAVEINREPDNCFLRLYQRQGHLKTLTPIMIITDMVIKQPYRQTIIMKADSTFTLDDFSEELFFQNSLVMSKNEEFMQYLNFWLHELGCTMTFYSKTIQYQTIYSLLNAMKDIVEEQNKWKRTV